MIVMVTFQNNVPKIIKYICNRVMAIDLLHTFVFAIYVENKWTYFDQTLYNYLY